MSAGHFHCAPHETLQRDFNKDNGASQEFTPDVEVVSIDEAYLDISGSKRLHGHPEKVALAIKKEIRETLQLTCSVGMAPGKFLAKVASDLDKPDGLTIIWPDDVQRFIATLPIQKVPGVGKKTFQNLESMGIKTLGDIKKIPEKLFIDQLGKFGNRLIELSSGLDYSEVTPDAPHKSVSSERTRSRIPSISLATRSRWPVTAMTSGSSCVSSGKRSLCGASDIGR